MGSVLAAMKRKKGYPSAQDEVAALDPGVFTSPPPNAAPAVALEVNGVRAQLLQSLREANERCIEMLVNAARTEAKDAFPLVNHLRSLLRELTPDIRVRAARVALLLVDMQLGNAAWWTQLQSHPNRPPPLAPARGSFPRASAVPLGRAILMLAWHSVRSDPVGTCLLGVSPEVARIIASFSLSELDRVIDRRFRHVRPRWEDRPAVWRALLLSAQVGDARRARAASLWAIQLMTGDLLARRAALH
jgi:hypothetical protein